MVDKFVLLASTLILSLNAFGAQFQIEATGAVTTSGPTGSIIISTSDWTVIFDDTSNDGLLQVDEIISFSGATVDVSVAAQTYVYDEIVGTPDLAGISAGSGGFNACCWWFNGPVIADPQDLDGWFTTRWSEYTITEVSVTPESILNDLVSEVVDLNLNAGLDNALDSKLENVLAALDRARDNNTDSAINLLEAFINSVEAQRGKAISDADADSLIESANLVIQLLS